MLLTTVRLLFMGWKVQQSSSLASGSRTSLMHRPSSVFQIRRVPSRDVDTIMSLLRDQAKSVTGPPWPFKVTFTLGGDGDKVMMESVPSSEQQASRCLSSLANCSRGTRENNQINHRMFLFHSFFLFLNPYSPFSLPAESTCWSNM